MAQYQSNGFLVLLMIVVVGLAVISLGSATTAFEREYRPFRQLNCSQCERAPTNKSIHRMFRITMDRLCRDKPDEFFKPCDPKMKPRGCGKLITHSQDITTPGQITEVTVVRRFCTSDALDKCTFYDGVASRSTLCVCEGDNCNHGNPSHPHLGYQLITLVSLVIGLSFA